MKTMKSGASYNCCTSGSDITGCVTVQADTVRQLLRPRDENAHKGTYGHTLIVAGSVGMMGAAVLCTGAALKSGCGLVTAHVPSAGRDVIHITNPSAIVSSDPSPAFAVLPDDMGRYSSIAVGPGLGKRPETVAALKTLLNRISGERGLGRTGDDGARLRTLVLDADALNIIASCPEMFCEIPSGTVLTPHIGELSRLVRAALSCGFISRDDAEENIASDMADARPWTDDAQKVRLVKSLSWRSGSVIVVKGAHTMTCAPDGRCFINMTGNPGMAKGGSGDILSGLIAGLAARGYDSLSAAVLGVWFHGLAGDRAAAERGEESMNASDILAAIRIG